MQAQLNKLWKKEEGAIKSLQTQLARKKKRTGKDGVVYKSVAERKAADKATVSAKKEADAAEAAAAAAVAAEAATVAEHLPAPPEEQARQPAKKKKNAASGLPVAVAEPSGGQGGPGMLGPYARVNAGQSKRRSSLRVALGLVIPRFSFSLR